MNESMGMEGQEASQERTQAEQMEHLAMLSQFAQEVGFVETAEMKAVKENPEAWSKEVTAMLGTMEKGSEQRQKAYLGYLLALASLYYEKRDKDKYFETVERAFDTAQEFDLYDIAKRIDETM